MTLDLTSSRSISEAYEIGPIVEVLVGDALWRLSVRRCITPGEPTTWTASYERRRWINIDGVATWHWVNESRLPSAQGESAGDCLRRAVAFIDRANPVAALHHDAEADNPGQAGDVPGDASDLGEELVRRLVPAEIPEAAPRSG